jgi:hypothetical protein
MFQLVLNLAQPGRWLVPPTAGGARCGWPARGVVLVVLALFTGMLSGRADTHIYAGALGTNQNDQLYFSNGLLFDANLSTFSFPQILRTNGLNKNYYRGDVLTFTALPGTELNGGPIGPTPGHAAFGSQLAIQLVSVAGPPGGSFAFWEGDGESDLGSITFSLPVGATNGTDYFVISQNAGVPNADPYGHIHGREFTTSLPGTYIVGFRIIDVSTNGAGGGPIHAPSDVFPLRFQAGIRIENLQRITNRVSAYFRSPTAINNSLEVTSSLESGSWQTVAGPLRGNNNLQFLTETNPPAGNRFYRIRVLNNLP